MTNTSPLIFYDRSRVVTDWSCPRKRYWNYEYMGRGIAPATTAQALYMGITLHDSLASLGMLTKLGQTVDARALAQDAFDQMFSSLYSDEMPDEARIYATEQATLVQGMVYAFTIFRWPQLLAQYPTILLTESEMIYTHTNGTLKFMSKPDLIMSNDEEVVYVEYKSTSSKKDSWMNSWSTAVQLHSTIRAVKESTGIDIDAVLVQGIYKGYESYGKQSSPFCYAYLRKGVPPFSKDEISYEYRSGYRRTPTWELPGGVYDWIDNMPANVLTDQFPSPAPIYIKNELVASFFEQRESRETEIRTARDEIKDIQELDGFAVLDEHSAFDSSNQVNHLLNKYFPQRFDQCTPYFGSPCSYSRLCHGPNVDPLTAGFEWRESHHSTEPLGDV